MPYIELAVGVTEINKISLFPLGEGNRFIIIILKKRSEAVEIINIL